MSRNRSISNGAIAGVLFHIYRVAVGRNGKWGRRRKVDLGELVGEPWILPPPDALAGMFVAEAFRALGLPAPRHRIATFSIHLRNHLVGDDDFITALPRSVLRLSGERHLLRELPIELSDRPSPVAIVTLANRTLGPAVQSFVECAREIAKSIHEPALARKRDRR